MTATEKTFWTPPSQPDTHEQILRRIASDVSMSGFMLALCSCEDGAYIGARKAMTPDRCERCGYYMTLDQFDAIVAAVRKHEETE